ncbi:MAG: epimerase, partial [Nitrospira sp. CR2.1]|nr:epimerase [Nitrospira sp. CR2.1]
ATREAAMRLGLVTIREMLAALLWAIEHPPLKTRVIDVPEIRRLGLSER